MGQCGGEYPDQNSLNEVIPFSIPSHILHSAKTGHDGGGMVCVRPLRK